MRDEIYDLAVVGGGASGMMAALEARRIDKGLRIVILERMNRLGKKLMATGNGRCNITNVEAYPQRYHGDVSFMAAAMSKYPPDEVMRRFDEYGVVCKVEEGGRAYPTSDQASSVLDALRMSLDEKGIETRCDCEVSALRPQAGLWIIAAADGQSLTARRVIVASGGLTAPNLGGSPSGYRLMEKLGYAKAPCLPSLVQLKTDPARVRALKGIRVDILAESIRDGRVIGAERGEVLFTDYGLSGPAILQLSRSVSETMPWRDPPQRAIRLHLVDEGEELVLERLRARRDRLAARPLENFLTGYINKRIGQALVKSVTDLPFVSPCGELDDRALAALSRLLTAWDFPILGTMGFDQAQVTAGGLRCAAFDPRTLESKAHPGLYAVGELLNIDGDCGGFNLQWAWASGMTAGASAARAAHDRPKEGGY